MDQHVYSGTSTLLRTEAKGFLSLPLVLTHLFYYIVRRLQECAGAPLRGEQLDRCQPESTASKRTLWLRYNLILRWGLGKLNSPKVTEK